MLTNASLTFNTLKVLELSDEISRFFEVCRATIAALIHSTSLQSNSKKTGVGGVDIANLDTNNLEKSRKCG